MKKLIIFACLASSIPLTGVADGNLDHCPETATILHSVADFSILGNGVLSRTYTTSKITGTLISIHFFGDDGRDPTQLECNYQAKDGTQFDATAQAGDGTGGHPLFSRVNPGAWAKWGYNFSCKDKSGLTCNVKLVPATVESK